MTTEHINITDAQRHEPKGASSAGTDTVLKSNGDGTTLFEKVDYSELTGARSNPISMGVWDYNDAATAGTPISIVSAATYYFLTNDILGTRTNTTYGLVGVGDIWDAATQTFDFSALSLGDTVDIRLDVTVTTAGVNHVIDLDLQLGIGSTPYQIAFVSGENYKTASTNTLTVWNSIYIGDTNTKDNPAKFRIKSDATGDSVVVNGWYIKVLTTNF